MADLMAAALAKLQGGGDLNTSALAQAAVAMLDGRHLQVAVDDPALAGILAEQGWDGSLRPPAESDFLAVVDSNVGFNKANAAVTQAIAYPVEPANGGLEATLTLTYTHTARRPAPSRSATAPRATATRTTLLSAAATGTSFASTRPAAANCWRRQASTGPRPSRASTGRPSSPAASSLRPGDQHVVTLRYRLPEDIPTSPYRLFVRKQAGTLAPPLTVEAGECRWVTDLSVDRVFVCDETRRGTTGTRGRDTGTRDRGHGEEGVENIRSYKELRVYQAGMDAAMRVFELTKSISAGGEVFDGGSDAQVIEISVREYRRSVEETALSRRVSSPS